MNMIQGIMPNKLGAIEEETASYKYMGIRRCDPL
jgi:hypothetical protein